jgi:hypothetical protein
MDTDGGIGVGEGSGVSVGAAVGVAVGVAVGAGRVAVDVSVGVGVGSLWMPAQLATIHDNVTTVKSFNAFDSVFISGSVPPLGLLLCVLGTVGAYPAKRTLARFGARFATGS